MKKTDVEIGATYVAKVSGTLARVRIERESPHGGWEAVNADTRRRVRIKSAQRLRREVSDPESAKPDAAGGASSATTPLADLRVGQARAAPRNPDVCATVGCDRPAALTYLGRPRCQECYEDDVADEGGTNETPDHEEIQMAKTKKTSKKNGTTRGKAGSGTKAAQGASGTKAAKPASTKATGQEARKPKGEPKPKRVSALDAAATVLQKAGKPLRSQEMIGAMAEQGLWSSPNGKTPHATLYAAILREITTRGKESRFKKVDRGQFEFNG